MVSAEPSFARRRASPLLRLMLKAPALLYRGPIADLMRSRCILLLTTRGRKSGQWRTGAVSFMPLPDGGYVVFSGWGTSSQWYRNIRANPDVVISLGRRRMRATARLVEDPERRKELMLQMRARSAQCGPPRPLRPLLKATRIFDYDSELAMAIRAGGTLPVIEITPS